MRRKGTSILWSEEYQSPKNKGSISPNKKGFVLLVAVFALTVFLLLGQAGLTLGYLESTLSLNQAYFWQAYYLARSGIENAVAVLAKYPEQSEGSGANLSLSFEEAGCRGTVAVTLTKPSQNGYLAVKSSAQLVNGPKKILEAKLTAPPLYVIYTDRVRVEQSADIAPVLNDFGREIPEDYEVPAEIEGVLVFSPGAKGAYQDFPQDALYFSYSNHTHRYRAPETRLEYLFSLSPSERERLAFPYLTRVGQGKVVIEEDQDGCITLVKGDLLVLASGGSVSLRHCYLVSSGDIWLVNMGPGTLEIQGLVMAGGDLNVWQGGDKTQVTGQLVAGKGINFYCLQGQTLINYDPIWFSTCPLLLQDSLGFLTFVSVEEVAS